LPCLHQLSYLPIINKQLSSAFEISKPSPSAADTLQYSLAYHNFNVVCTILNVILSGFSDVTGTQSNDNQGFEKLDKRKEESKLTSQELILNTQRKKKSLYLEK